MEILALIFHTIEAFLGLLDLASLGFDVYSWFRGAENRTKRKEAKKLGQPVPKPDKWYWAVVISTFVAIISTALLIFRYAIR